jgi:hypothetical protein
VDVFMNVLTRGGSDTGPHDSLLSRLRLSGLGGGLGLWGGNHGPFELGQVSLCALVGRVLLAVVEQQSVRLEKVLFPVGEGVAGFGGGEDHVSPVLIELIG